MPIAVINDISYSYRKLNALSGVSFEVNRGDYLCLVGPNGGGKSTLIKLLVGLMAPDKGKIEINCPQSRISYLPQHDDTERDFPATVKEIVLCGTQAAGKAGFFYTAADKSAAQRAMSLMGVESFAGKRIGELSGGQRQRVLLARALCRNPELLILDEPCTGLDPEITCELYTILSKLNEEQGITVVMSSHGLEEVAHHAGRVIELNNKVIFDGSCEEWLAYRTEEL
jgi:zinc transport system ATP-binding protein